MSFDGDLMKFVDERIRAAGSLQIVMGTMADPPIFSPAPFGTVTCTVIMDGTSLAVPAKCFLNLRPRQGERVGLVKFGSEWVVVGTFSPYHMGFLRLWPVALSFQDSAPWPYVPGNIGAAVGNLAQGISYLNVRSPQVNGLTVSEVKLSAESVVGTPSQIDLSAKVIQINPTVISGHYTQVNGELRLTAATVTKNVCASANGINVVSGGGTVAAAGYVNLSATSSFNFVKQYDSTQIKLFMSVDATSSAVNTVGLYGVRINSVDYDVTELTVNQTGLHVCSSATAYIAVGLTAGTYTVQGRWQRTAGAGTITAGGRLSISAEEVSA